MHAVDAFRFALRGVAAHRLRSALTALGIAVGIAAVVILTAIGEGVRQYVLAEFTQFGTHLMGIAPGRSSTFGAHAASIRNVRPLTLEDATALGRLPGIEGVVPVVQGNAAVEHGERSRRTMILGVGPAVPEVWRFPVGVGRFLPDDDPQGARAFAVLGSTLARELFGGRSPLGEAVRIGSERYRVVGVMAEKGQFLGIDLNDSVFVPAAKAMQLFNLESLMEVDVLYAEHEDAARVRERIKALLVERHGQEDFTVITQQEMLDVLGNVLGILTLAVGALGGISLAVGGVGILTIMTIAVTERAGEVGLLRALGASRRQVLGLFLGEAVALAAVGGIAGIAGGIGFVWLVAAVLPALPLAIAWPYVGIAEAVAVVIGLMAGVLPALRAARLDPVEALRAE